jgi:5'-nucleotidase
LVKQLISNDDGVNASGIRVLHETLMGSGDITVVAPLNERSTTGHSLSLDAPVRIQEIRPGVYGCSGFPADCALVGLGHIMKNDRPDLIISGINKGANLGQDLYYSGTMAAAREASFHGIPAVSVSLVLDRPSKQKHYETAARFIRHMVEQNVHQAIPELTMVNVNVPNLPLEQIKGVRWTKMGVRRYSEQIEHRLDSRNRDYYWIAGLLNGHREQGGETDCEAVADGYIALTPLNLIIGEQNEFTQLRELYESSFKHFKHT